MIPVMQRIEREEYQKRLDRISEIFSRMMQRAEELSTERCPYKDRLDQCTAKFGCRNKRPAPAADQLPLCAGDDKLDYRGAWETS